MGRGVENYDLILSKQPTIQLTSFLLPLSSFPLSQGPIVLTAPFPSFPLSKLLTNWGEVYLSPTPLLGLCLILPETAYWSQGRVRPMEPRVFWPHWLHKLGTKTHLTDGATRFWANKGDKSSNHFGIKRDTQLMEPRDFGSKN